MPRAQKSKLEVFIETLMAMPHDQAAEMLAILTVVNRSRAGAAPARPVAPRPAAPRPAAVPAAAAPAPRRRRRAAEPAPVEEASPAEAAEPADAVGEVVEG